MPGCVFPPVFVYSLYPPALSLCRYRPFPSPSLHWRTWALPPKGCQLYHLRQYPQVQSHCHSRSQSERNIHDMKNISLNPLKTVIYLGDYGPEILGFSSTVCWTTCCLSLLIYWWSGVAYELYCKQMGACVVSKKVVESWCFQKCSDCESFRGREEFS